MNNLRLNKVRRELNMGNGMIGRAEWQNGRVLT